MGRVSQKGGREREERNVRVLVYDTRLGEKGQERGSYEVNANGGDEGLCERVIRKAKKERRLSYTRVTDEEELEEVITGNKEED